jgi:signal transduction histidine kinase
MLENMFRSARLKLTLFYLVIIVMFSLVVTVTIRVVAEREFIHANSVQRSEVKELVVRYFQLPGGKAAAVFEDAQQLEAERVRDHLNQALIGINLVALSFGTLISYWFAGRTLKPIEEAHEAQARFTADASHELRTPLTNMRLENEIFLRQKEFTADEARELITSNLEEIARLENLSSNLLALAQYGQVQLEREPAAVRLLVKKALAQVNQSFEAKHMKVAKDLAEGRVLVHEGSLVQMLTILLDNAQKYGPSGGTVALSGRTSGQQYLLSIADQGPGIDPADLPYIFDRLYRGDKARTGKAGGYGLGLSLAREIAAANEASITAANAPGGGAVFTVTLERAAAKPKPADGPFAKPSPT